MEDREPFYVPTAVQALMELTTVGWYRKIVTGSERDPAQRRTNIVETMTAIGADSMPSLICDYVVFLFFSKLRFDSCRFFIDK
jgi:hypothetical protein